MKRFIIAVVLFWSVPAFSADEISNKNVVPNPKEENSVKSPEDDPTKERLVLSSFVEIPTHSFLISTGAGRVDQRQVDQRIQYNPTFGPNLGIKGSYGRWALILSKRLSFINAQDKQKYGKTEYDDWRLGFNITKAFLIETYFQKYRGFYTDLNGQEGLQMSFGPNEPQSPSENGKMGESIIINRPDISALNYGLKATYALPLMPFFEFLSLFGDFNSEEEFEEVKETEEAKNMGDLDFNLLTMMYFNRLSITGDFPLVPASTSNSFSPIASMKEYWFNTLGVGLGMGFGLPVSKSVTVGMVALGGVGFQRQANVFVNHESVDYTIAEELNAKAYVGWKGNNNGLRFDFYVDSFGSKVNDINFDNSSLGINLVYSYSGIYF